MNTLKSLVILSLVLAVATGEREKRGLSNWCRAFGCPPDSAFKNGRDPSLSENDWQRFPETFQVPSAPAEKEQVQNEKDSELEHGKNPPRDGYENMKAYLQDVYQ
ncbi:uncharacterized protein LOC110063703 isoform X1 [Orbicella faveolata]|uniref:uncharacterized protein LOC110063703 isoform X1 n=1 Tax=Orbicella faveolata TaxID=48498 RepID=UPI0009E5028E|nr:uncharacterized protein LOC110063703 isoform X1 [Orbicella faveolata]